MKVNVYIFLVLCTFVLHALPVMAIDFPGRKNPKYGTVQTIEINRLYNDYLENKVTLIDVRSLLEYETIHIKGAFHVSMAEQTFESELGKVVRDNPGKKTAFY
ncbi:MAG TPA: rhodanese-like domain-containing protein [Desulfocapsa sulfexigens]|nr:rhodanese-like domain-containing protein [Desulfocapsa sulfexigens]